MKTVAPGNQPRNSLPNVEALRIKMQNKKLRSRIVVPNIRGFELVELKLLCCVLRCMHIKMH